MAKTEKYLIRRKMISNRAMKSIKTIKKSWIGPVNGLHYLFLTATEEDHKKFYEEYTELHNDKYGWS